MDTDKYFSRKASCHGSKYRSSFLADRVEPGTFAIARRRLDYRAVLLRARPLSQALLRLDPSEEESDGGVFPGRRADAARADLTAGRAGRRLSLQRAYAPASLPDHLWAAAAANRHTGMDAGTPAE